ncbi:DUF2079 domain-containing protein [Waterburya agarophytonicola K14]|uniref:DUF2079 domain-containing protein n=1 Tax=Waterburya agarophytonicola KI4 TaxID=2874699 RepID=A0A964BTC6_9CYAN|nr:DUF2079 domain-containing protein [Waterburya agarophytonicola]MCC0178357.1 DUF2079 domain-containing protein [Waterburya agarophytonicola KI4]
MMLNAVKKSITEGESKFFLLILLAIATGIFVAASSFRHGVFRSGTDLAFFDQLVFLLSQGLLPVSSILPGVHLIGDHAAFVLYPIGLLYVIFPDVHWLLLVQAISLVSGAIPIYALSLNAGLAVATARTVAVCYVLYPGLFNINFYTELRTETIAVTALLWATWAFKTDRDGWAAIAVIVTLLSKEAMSITVVGLGVWLWWERKRFIPGLICILSSIGWFLLSAIYIIPNFRGGHQMAGTWHYESIGDSLPEIALKVLVQPQLLLVRSIAPDRLFYYLLLLLPIAIGLHWRKIGALIPALPMLGLNILADYSGQRDLIHHYSLPIIPFLFVWLIDSLGYLKRYDYRQWLSRRLLIIWAIIGFLTLAKFSYFWTRYLPLMPNARIVDRAISLIKPEDKVLTTGFVAPHLSHRPIIKLLEGDWDLARIKQEDLDTVLIAMQHLSAATPEEKAIALKVQLGNSPEFNLVYHQQDVFLFQQRLQ